MAHLTRSVEYGIHCLLWLMMTGERRPSSRDLAELQGVSPSFVAKIFPKLEKAGIVAACEGVSGGYRLARPPEQITILELVDAIEGDKPLFECQEIRVRCALFDGSAPRWATRGPCAIHAIMLRAEKSMRASLACETLASLARTLAGKAPAEFSVDVQVWIDDRANARRKTKARKFAKPGPRTKT